MLWSISLDTHHDVASNSLKILVKNVNWITGITLTHPLLLLLLMYGAAGKPVHQKCQSEMLKVPNISQSSFMICYDDCYKFTAKSASERENWSGFGKIAGKSIVAHF